MKSPAFSTHNRRTSLKYLAGSPCDAALGGIPVFAEGPPEIAEIIADPKEAFRAKDFVEATRRKVDPVQWAFLASGVDDDATLRANREGLQHIQLRPRLLRDGSRVDMRTDLFGTVYNSAIFTCPASGEKFLSPSGWRTRRSACHQSARDHANAFHFHRSRGCELCPRQARVVPTPRSQRVGGVRKTCAEG